MDSAGDTQKHFDPQTGAGLGWRSTVGSGARPTAAPMRGTTKRPEVKTVNPGEQARERRRVRRKGLDARRRKQEERPLAKTRKDRAERKVARAVGDSLEFRHPETADDDDRLIDDNESVSSTEERRAALGFPAGQAFGVAVPKRNVSQFAKRPSTAPTGRGYLSRQVRKQSPPQREPHECLNVTDRWVVVVPDRFRSTRAC